jgi:hypothetical protein
MKSNEVNYYDLSGNDSWQLKMIKLINSFNYSVRQLPSAYQMECIKNTKKTRDILNSSSRNFSVIESNLKSNSWKKSNVISLCQKVFQQLAQGAS